MKNSGFNQIVVHKGNHHADDVLACNTVHQFYGELPVTRKIKPTEKDLQNPRTLVLDFGQKLQPDLGNIDHHQNGKIHATNILVLNVFVEDEDLKVFLKENLYSYVDHVDRGKIAERTNEQGFNVPTFNSIIRNLNSTEDGFNKALKLSKLAMKGLLTKYQNLDRGYYDMDRNLTGMKMLRFFYTVELMNNETMRSFFDKHILTYTEIFEDGKIAEEDHEGFKTPTFSSIIESFNYLEDGHDTAFAFTKLVMEGFLATAEKTLKGRENWMTLEKRGMVAFNYQAKNITGWRELAEKEGIVAVISPNYRAEGSFQMESRDTDIFKIPPTIEQTFLHANQFIASYLDWESCLNHAVELKLMLPYK